MSPNVLYILSLPLFAIYTPHMTCQNKYLEFMLI